MPKYKKRPVVIDAFRFGHDDQPSWFSEAGAEGKVFIQSRPSEIPKKPITTCVIATLEGNMAAVEGDWIIRGVKGELYPVANDIFEMTYEAVD